MPTYDYRCKQCGTTHEIAHGFNDPRPTTCPACGGQLARVFHPVGVVFKGSGFHKTDYAGTGAKKDAAEPAAPKADSAKSDGAKTEGSASSAPAAPKSEKPPAATPPPGKSDSKPSGSS
ncbi:MAG TPA: FmdB family zinc ribbon protein [Candidatus Eremiobacteraceae bacterium]|nr:FmdB family zinc ribbon protein [Candidatus Eremiobacteraceae bacterium]